MSQSIELDKHEMVIDKEEYEYLVKINTELLEACKEARALLKSLINSSTQITMLDKAIAKAEGR